MLLMTATIPPKCITGAASSTAVALVPVPGAVAMAGSSLWPLYTDIVKPIGKAKTDRINLGVQSYEVKLVIHKALKLVEGRIRFRHAFPEPIEHAIWNRECIEKACDSIGRWSASAVKKKYEMIRERVGADEEYLSDISSMVHQF
jgi:hypothetical protein